MADEHAEACRGLWLAVLLQGLEDAQGGDSGWLGTPSYFTIASLAGLDLDAAGDLARRATIRAAMPAPASQHSARQPSKRRRRKARADA